MFICIYQYIEKLTIIDPIKNILTQGYNITRTITNKNDDPY